MVLGHAEFGDLSSEVLKRGSAVRFAAHGASMWPFIRSGDILTVRPMDAAALNVGDVILRCAGNGGLLAHRVVSRHAQGARVSLVTRGDAVVYPDGPIGLEQVLGRVTSICRGDKILDVERGWPRMAAMVWNGLYPLGPLALRLAYRARRRLELWMRPGDSGKPGCVSRTGGVSELSA